MKLKHRKLYTLDMIPVLRLEVVVIKKKLQMERFTTKPRIYPIKAERLRRKNLMIFLSNGKTLPKFKASILTIKLIFMKLSDHEFT